MQCKRGVHAWLSRARAAQRSLVHTTCVVHSLWTHARAHPRARATARAPPTRGAEQLDFNPTRFTYLWLRVMPHRADANATYAQASPNLADVPSLMRVDQNIELDFGINTQVVAIAAKVACEVALG